MSPAGGRLFASTALAARIERAECRLLIDCADAVTRRRSNAGDPRADVHVRQLAGGVATWTTDGSPLNKVAGLGFEGPLDEADLAAVEKVFAARGAAVKVELSSLAEPSIGTLLTERGYALSGFENVLGLSLPLPEPPRAGEGIEISRSGPDELSTWMDVVVTGFCHPDTQGTPSHESYPRELLERVLLDVAEAEGLVRYIARIGGEPVGGASMRMFEGVAQLCGAATLPEYRRRGVQSTLLATRLSEAARSGCDVAVVTTLPGSKSQENVQRQGFELLYARAILQRGK